MSRVPDRTCDPASFVLGWSRCGFEWTTQTRMKRALNDDICAFRFPVFLFHLLVSPTLSCHSRVVMRAFSLCLVLSPSHPFRLSVRRKVLAVVSRPKGGKSQEYFSVRAGNKGEGEAATRVFTAMKRGSPITFESRL